MKKKILLAIMSLTTLFSMVGCSSSKTASSTSSIISQANESLKGCTFKDGTYTGSAQGFGPNLTVSVNINSNKITSVDIVSQNEENPDIYQKAIDTIPKEIVDNQSVDVDAVSGTTFTSTGIKNAVINALSKALTSGTLPDSFSLPQERRH